MAKTLTVTVCGNRVLIPTFEMNVHVAHPYPMLGHAWIDPASVGPLTTAREWNHDYTEIPISGHAPVRTLLPVSEVIAMLQLKRGG